MQKISRILPQTTRMQNVDIERAPAARPGAPAWGRPPGVVTQHERIQISNEAREMLKDRQLKTTASPLPQFNAMGPEVSEIELADPLLTPEGVSSDMGFLSKSLHP